jgi:hypothetical protein
VATFEHHSARGAFSLGFGGLHPTKGVGRMAIDASLQGPELLQKGTAADRSLLGTIAKAPIDGVSDIAFPLLL